MGRPTGGGGSRSSGGHSGSRSSGGHRVGGGRPTGSRPTGGSSYGGRYSPGGGYYGGYGRGYGYGRYNRPVFFGGGGGMGLGSTVILIVIICLALVCTYSGMADRGNGSIANTKNRTKIENPVPFQNDCIEDETGWIENTGRLSRDLQEFYDKTGVQPYIVLKSYDAALVSDQEKEAYAQQWYEEHIDNEYTFLYMYFQEASESEIGYMAYVNGKAVSSVMDAEAVNIFWDYIDRYWMDESMSMDQVFQKTFDSTADTIMEKSKTTQDVMWMAVIVTGVIALAIAGILFFRMKAKREKEKAKEAADILNAPLEDSTDTLRDKYL